MLGFDPGRNEVALKERTGIVLQRTGLEPYLTVSETIDMFRGYYPRPLPLNDIIEVGGLEEQRDQRVRRLSGGQQRRLDVAVGLAGDPELLFLDEPTTGFDPTARRGAWAMIRNLRTLGKTVLLTTHYLDEAQALADRVAIMVRGEIVAEDTPAGLVAADADAVIRFRAPAGLAPARGARAAGRGRGPGGGAHDRPDTLPARPHELGAGGGHRAGGPHGKPPLARGCVPAPHR